MIFIETIIARFIMINNSSSWLLLGPMHSNHNPWEPAMAKESVKDAMLVWCIDDWA